MTGTSSTDGDRVNLLELLDQFYDAPSAHAQLGDFRSVLHVPPPYDDLLDHHKHMTVTVEAHYGQSVNVNVHRCHRDGDWYCREITLVTESSRRIVQYGIVRLRTTALADEVWRQIESEQIPLGRVLIQHNVLREVQLCGLWEVHAGPSLADRLRCKTGEVLYGRTALIYCDGTPAIELLEVVAPLPH